MEALAPEFHQSKEENAYPYTVLAEGIPDEQRRHQTQSLGTQTLTWSPNIKA